MTVADGGYKLLFLLPVFPGTRRVLLLDAEFGALARRLTDAGIEKPWMWKARMAASMT